MTAETTTTKEEIIAAARRRFSSAGYRATSMNEIADVVGVKKSSLYYFFSSKADLFFVVLQKVITEQKRLFSGSSSKKPQKFLREAIEKSLRRGVEAGQILYVPHTVGESASTTVLEKLKKEAESMLAVLSDLCARCGICEPRQAAHVIVDSSRGYLVRKEMGDEALSPAAYAEKMVHLLTPKN